MLGRISIWMLHWVLGSSLLLAVHYISIAAWSFYAHAGSRLPWVCETALSTLHDDWNIAFGIGILAVWMASLAIRDFRTLHRPLPSVHIVIVELLIAITTLLFDALVFNVVRRLP